MMCNEYKCKKQPIFNIVGEKALYCLEHKLDIMVDVKNKICLEPSCKTRPSYNNPGKNVALYCSEHKLGEMVNVVSKTCLELSCEKQPAYNNPGEKITLYCSEHKLDRMINVKNKTCLEPSCKKQPIFNVLSEKIALFCSDHKLDEMIDVKHKTCLEPSCITRPIYNLPGTKVALYCLEHKLDVMVDVKHKTCSEKLCKSRPTFNIPGHSPAFCTKHKKEGYIKNPTRKCSSCNSISIFGKNSNDGAEHCYLHKEDDEINLIERKCSECEMTYILNEYGICDYCDPRTREKVIRKEIVIKNLLDKNNIKYNSHDRTIENGNRLVCGQRRPDFLFDCNEYFLCLEVDENQHRVENYSCECKRMFEIVGSIGMPVFFLRYNPDSFKNIDGRKSRISTSKRHDILLRAVKSLLECPPKDESEFIRIRYLFYDGWFDGDIDYETIKYKHN